MAENLTPLPKNWAARFFTIWTGQAISMFGSSLVQFALVWWLTRQTGSATILATASLVAMLPQVLLGPIAGAFADRHNRRVIMIVSDSLTALATLLLAVLFATGWIQIWHVYVLMAVRSVCGTFQFPAMSASTSVMVPKEQLTRVGGLNQMLQGLMGLVAPPVGALLISVLPTQGVLMIDVGTALLAVAPLLFIAIPQPVRRDMEVAAAGAKPSLLADMKEGLTFVLAWPGLLAIGVMATIINFLLTPMGALMPLLITKHFGLGALELGFTDTAWGIGIIAGGIILSAWGGFKRRIFTTLMGIVGLGLGVVLVGIAPAGMFALALAGMVLIGAMNSFANGPLHAIVQTVVPAEMQGRVMSLIGTVAMAMSPLSLLIAGPLSDAFDIRVWYWLGGALSLLMGVIGFFIPAVVNVENNRREVQPSATPAVMPTIE
jgi:DHA3 family macrolide efflux protein-like MFS transporter